MSTCKMIRCRRARTFKWFILKKDEDYSIERVWRNFGF